MNLIGKVGLTAAVSCTAWLWSVSTALAQCDEAKEKRGECDKGIEAHKGECRACRGGRPCDVPVKKARGHDDWRKEHERKCGECTCDDWKRAKSEHDDGCAKEKEKHSHGCKGCRSGQDCEAWRKKKEEHDRRCGELKRKHQHGCPRCNPAAAKHGDCEHWKNREEEHEKKCDEIRKKHSHECRACAQGEECPMWNKKREHLEREKQSAKDQHRKDCGHCGGGGEKSKRPPPPDGKRTGGDDGKGDH
jgi:hypothetical protein